MAASTFRARKVIREVSNKYKAGPFNYSRLLAGGWHVVWITMQDDARGRLTYRKRGWFAVLDFNQDRIISVKRAV